MIGALNLQKNDVLDLTKKNPSLKNVVLAAGWDVTKKGFFGFGHECDIDLVAFLLNKDGKMINKKSGVIYFANKTGNGILLHGDNLTGEGDGDDEKISVSLNKLPISCDKVIFATVIYEAKKRKQSFSQVKNAYVRLLDKDKGESEICRYNLTQDGGEGTALLFAQLQKNNNDWQFKALGELVTASLGDLIKIYE
ncbi:TerD family protein [Clostridium tarantellae]|uniref:TerD family protein n=1 Tax=Clostridium tarantellae TaxID=39493 RepID=A0A6I1MJH8_9CLOT|nr:TerD family protein [Clostridium tarantellae]MPQ42863.1 TerD family protein [Clostridium tarantellae]